MQLLWDRVKDAKEVSERVQAVFEKLAQRMGEAARKAGGAGDGESEKESCALRSRASAMGDRPARCGGAPARGGGLGTPPRGARGGSMWGSGRTAVARLAAEP